MTRRTARKPATDPGRAVGYARVSTRRQDLGPEAQRAAMAKWCEANDVDLVAVHEDRLTGATELADRPGFMAALSAVREHGAGVFLVAKRDRLGRDALVSAMVERLAERAGARVVSAAGEGTDDDGPAGLLMRRIVDAFAEYERSLIRQRTREALAVKKAKGERVGHVGYGARLAADGVHVEPDPDEQRVLAIVRGYRAEGLSLRAIGARLTARGILPRSGGKWYGKTVARVVRTAEREAA